jgi:hypothetical protein
LAATGIVTIASAPFALPVPGGLEGEQSLEDGRDLQDVEAEMPALFERAVLSWENGEIRRALQEFAEVVRLKRRLAELAVEEL